MVTQTTTLHTVSIMVFEYPEQELDAFIHLGLVALQLVQLLLQYVENILVLYGHLGLIPSNPTDNAVLPVVLD